MTTPRPAGERAGELAALAAKAAVCTDCRLCESRTHVVFGSGDPDADVMFVGEGPGQREDEQGLPFVGPSGHLLEELLTDIGLTRADVYIANVVKCRPPGNRDPRPDEIDACKGYLRLQLELIDPRVVVTLGNFSTKLMLRTEVGITRLRGIAYEWWGRHLIPTYHPAAGLRGGERVLEELRSDFELIRRSCGRYARCGCGSGEPTAGLSEEQPLTALAPGEPEPEQLGLFGS